MLNRALLGALFGAALLAGVAPAAHAELSWPDKVELGAALYEIRGHIYALEVNLGASPGAFASDSFRADAMHARAHAGHPIGEVYPSISETISAADAASAESLGAALTALNTRVNAGVETRDEIETELNAAKQAVDAVQRATLGASPSDDPALNAAIASSLIELSASEYEEAIVGGELTHIVELQDAYAFLKVSHMDLFRGTTYMDYQPAQQSDYEDSFNEFYAVYDNINDPSESTRMAMTLSDKLDSTFTPSDGMMDNAVGSMDDMKDMQMMSGDQLSEGLAGAAQRIDNIKVLLDVAKREYMDGNTLQASALVSEAYTNEYEFVEDDLDSIGQRELREDIEITLRETIILSIRSNSPDVPSAIDMVSAQLDTAKAALLAPAAGSGPSDTMDPSSPVPAEPAMRPETMETETDKMEETPAGGCLIATAAYGTEMAAEVQALREVRDSTLLQTGAGSAFMAAFNEVYYSFSPTVADWERQSPEFRSVVRALITPMVASLSIMSAADADSEMSVLSLGAAVIALNLGLYVAAPATLAWRLGRR